MVFPALVIFSLIIVECDRWRDILERGQLLIDIAITDFAKELVKLGNVSDPHFALISLLHLRGINIRHLGRVFVHLKTMPTPFWQVSHFFHASRMFEVI